MDRKLGDVKMILIMPWIMVRDLLPSQWEARRASYSGLMGHLARVQAFFTLPDLAFSFVCKIYTRARLLNFHVK